MGQSLSLIHIYISVAGYPKMSVESAGPEGVVLIAEVAEKPEISVENYKGVVAPYEDVEVTEHDIEAVSYTHLDVYKRQRLAAFCHWRMGR